LEDGRVEFFHMIDKKHLNEEQEYIDIATSAREFRRGNRYSGKANISSALSQPVNSLAGGRLQSLRELGDVTESV
jgi:hypothetical protein